MEAMITAAPADPRSTDRAASGIVVAAAPAPLGRPWAAISLLAGS
jgi:hypothetical protein